MSRDEFLKRESSIVCCMENFGYGIYVRSRTQVQSQIIFSGGLFNGLQIQNIILVISWNPTTTYS